MTDTIMHNYVAEAIKIITEAKAHKNYSQKLSNIIEFISSISIDLNTSKELFLSGGYVDDNGKCLYQSEINNIIAISDELVNDINNLIRKTNFKIDYFKDRYIFIKSNFETEKSIYLSSDIQNGYVPVFPEFII